jgi:hypothetical protein
LTGHQPIGELLHPALPLPLPFLHLGETRFNLHSEATLAFTVSKFLLMRSRRPEACMSEKMRRVLDSPNTVDNDRLLDDTESSDTWSYEERKPRRRYGSWWTVAFLIFTGVLSFLVGGFLGYHYQEEDLDEVCTRHISHYCKSTIAPSVDGHEGYK